MSPSRKKNTDQQIVRSSLKAAAEQLVSLPAPDKTGFFSASRKVAEQLREFALELHDIAADQSMDSETRIKALYFVLYYLRRQRDLREYRQLVDEFRRHFGSHPIFRTFDVVYERSLGDDPRSMARAIRASRRALEHYTDSPGVLHQYGELIVTDYETNHQTQKEALKDAEKVVEKAISLNWKSNAHYWNTLARVQCALEDFRSARRSIAEAIELEESDSKDYVLRLSEHQLVETRIAFAEERKRAEERENAAQSELHSIRAQMLEILGLLAAIIAFITTTATLTSGNTFKDSARLLFISASLIIIVFSVFAYAFNVSSFRRIILPLIAGVGTLIMVIFFIK